MSRVSCLAVIGRVALELLYVAICFAAIVFGAGVAIVLCASALWLWFAI